MSRGRRYGLVLTLTVLVCAIGASAKPPTASAYRGGTDSPVTDPAHKEAVKAYIRSTGYVPTKPGVSSANVATGLYRARVAASVMPALGSITLGATAVAIAYKVGNNDAVQDFFYTKITGNSLTNPVAGAGSPLRWDLLSAAACSSSGWGSASCFRMTANGNGSDFFDSASWQPSYMTRPDVQAAIAHGLARGATVYGTKYILPSPAMRRQFVAEPMTASEYAAFAGTKPASTTMPTTMSDAELNTALSELGADTETEGDPAAEEFLDDINYKLDPTYSADLVLMPNLVGLSRSAAEAALSAAGFTGAVTWVELGLEGAVVTLPAGAVVTQSIGASTQTDPAAELELARNPDPNPLEVPQPEANETYADYIERLQTAGWVGTVTYIDADPVYADPLMGPNAVTRIAVPARGTSWRPAEFPLPLPRLWPSDDITITRNPPDAPPAEGPLPVPGDLPDEDGGCSCPTTELDLGIELDTEGKIPFAVVSYLTEAVETLAAPPVQPGLTIPVGFAEDTGIDEKSLPLKLPDEWDTDVDGYFEDAREIEGWIIRFLGVLFLVSHFLRSNNPDLTPSGFDHENLDWSTGESKNAAIRDYERRARKGRQ